MNLSYYLLLFETNGFTWEIISIEFCKKKKVLFGSLIKIYFCKWRFEFFKIQKNIFFYIYIIMGKSSKDMELIKKNNKKQNLRINEA